MKQSLFYKLVTLSILSITLIAQADNDNDNDIEFKEMPTSVQENITSTNPKSASLVAERLQRILANHVVLSTKTQKYHWNVEGKHFNDLHAFFGKLYTALQTNIDLVAERMRALGVKVDSTLTQFKSQATLSENPQDNLSEKEMIKSLLQDYQALIKELKADLIFAQEQGDAATNNFLTDLVFQYEKSAWMLNALLNK